MMRDSMRDFAVQVITILLFLSSPIWAPLLKVFQLVGRWYSYLYDVVDGWL
jgi:hypothetical protein